MKLRYALLGLLVSGAAAAQSLTPTGIGDLPSATSGNPTDMYIVCQSPPCHAGTQLNSIQFNKFPISGTPPITYNPNTGAIGLAIDSTLSVVGGALHVVGGGGGGGVSSISQGTGLSFSVNPLVATGTIGIANTAVTPGSYTNTNLTVNAQGQITAASNGSGGGSGFTGGITVASACTGASCTPVTSCMTYSTGSLSGFASGACSGTTNFLLIGTGSKMLINTGSSFLIQ